MIKGKELFDLILNAYAIEWDGKYLVYPRAFDKWIGDAENEVMYLSTDDDGLVFKTKLLEESFDNPKFDEDGTITVYDFEGDPVYLKLLSVNKLDF